MAKGKGRLRLNLKPAGLASTLEAFEAATRMERLSTEFLVSRKERPRLHSLSHMNASTTRRHVGFELILGGSPNCVRAGTTTPWWRAVALGWWMQSARRPAPCWGWNSSFVVRRKGRFVQRCRATCTLLCMSDHSRQWAAFAGS